MCSSRYSNAAVFSALTYKNACVSGPRRRTGQSRRATTYVRAPRSMTKRRWKVLALAICLSFATVALLNSNSVVSLGRSHPRATMENARFVASSRSWFGRVSCRWFGICGGMNWWRNYRRTPDGPAPAKRLEKKITEEHKPHDFHDAWIDPAADPESWSKHERRLRTIPEYVLDYAPLVHLYGKEKYWPSDIAEHLENTIAKLDDDTIPDFKLNLWNLADLNAYDGGRQVFLTSKDDPEQDPGWMLSQHNIPGVPMSGRMTEKAPPIESTPGKRKGQKNIKERARKEGWGLITPNYNAYEEELTPIEGDADSDREEPAFEIKVPQLHLPDLGAQKSSRSRRGSHASRASNTSGSTHVSQGPEEHIPGLRSNAPGFLICIDKGDGIVDAFWFYFYSFNEGNTVLGIRFGNHIGDWEHTMVRFQHGVPKALYLSRHSWGSIYSYEALEKIGKRPVVYSGDGSHAHYPIAGRQDYVLPLGMLHDTTSRGPLWDPVQNLKSFTYDPVSDNLRASTLNPKAPTSWFHFAGRWGDRHYDLSDPRQYRFWGEYHYANGPTGPKFKHLKRTALSDNDKGNIQDYVS